MQLNCDADQLRFIVDKVKPYAVRVDRFLVPRCFFMRQPIPAFAVFIMAIGMATDDGAVALVGVSLSLFGFILGFERLAVALS